MIKQPCAGETRLAFQSIQIEHGEGRPTTRRSSLLNNNMLNNYAVIVTPCTHVGGAFGEYYLQFRMT
ncbi:hypothetical protein [Pseudarthrobacter niigatensis]|uniref:Uncharacterized protein n=1 Tax=Pseudarthrobacter niigatensis TaxID=369935 RepID=A0AAJ1SR24_9MICC|nr:hypothetical protein [Pseudarthrobacter niigatensis]MDQ0144424.1 hypothetical protein [Pseudarthrobacter niigatensis]MDQ0265070.1 hypothetical protein [Pseudarthrobacter niigatensis]